MDAFKSAWNYEFNLQILGEIVYVDWVDERDKVENSETVLLF